jgi:hydrogenase maturation protease
VSARILVAGVGNIFFGDDGFGPEVLRRLCARPLPDGVRAVDFGIRGLDLAFALLDGYDALILVDAAPRGGSPGTLYVIEPNSAAPPTVETHGLGPGQALDLMRALGGRVPQLRLLACEPARLTDEEEPIMGLSEPVSAAIEPAVALVGELIAQLKEAPADA